MPDARANSYLFPPPMRPSFSRTHRNLRRPLTASAPVGGRSVPRRGATRPSVDARNHHI